MELTRRDLEVAALQGRCWRGDMGRCGRDGVKSHGSGIERDALYDVVMHSALHETSSGLRHVVL
jgi:hypothetical protein